MILRAVTFAAAIALAGVTAPRAFAQGQQGQQAAADTAMRNYIVCVRRAAETLERSDESPSDVARASVFVCISLEGNAMNLNRSMGFAQVRENGIWAASAQAVVARACRRAQVWGLALIPELQVAAP